MINDNYIGFKVYIFLPSNFKNEHIGGAQSFFIQFVKYCNRELGFKCVVIDIKNGRLANRLNSDDAFFLNFNYCPIVLQGKSILISTPSYIPDIWKNIVSDDELKILFWSLTYSDFTNYFKYISIYSRIRIKYVPVIMKMLENDVRNSVVYLVNYLINSNSLFYMSGKNILYINQFLNYNFKISLLPVSIDKFSRLKLDSHIKKFDFDCQLQLCWIGRFAKLSSIRNILYSLRNIENVRLHIIGWGDNYSIKLIRKFGKRYNVEIVIIPPLYDSDLDNYLLENIHCGIGMGLSLLNFSSLGIPCIATEYHYGYCRKRSYLYKWFYQLPDFDLATRNYLDSNEVNLSDLKCLIVELSNYYSLISDRCYSLYKEKFNFDVVVSNCLLAATRSNCNMSALKSINSKLFIDGKTKNS